MAVLKKHSFDEKRIRRYLIADRIKDGNIVILRSVEDLGSYYNAIENGFIYDYDGSNFFIARIDPYQYSMMKSYVEHNKFKKALTQIDKHFLIT